MNFIEDNQRMVELRRDPKIEKGKFSWWSQITEKCLVSTLLGQFGNENLESGVQATFDRKFANDMNFLGVVLN